MAKKGRIFSGMRPTGPLHLGHLVGALENWVKFQDEYDCIYCVVDWHALMSEYKDPTELKTNIRSMVADWLACGLSPDKSLIFVQSDVPEHLELCMAFSIVTPIPWVERVPTFKEQVEALQEKEVYTYAFLGYPVLQAADICLYKADTVPVGDDQLPHLELTREIVRRFHNLYGVQVFPEPEARLTRTPRLLGLDRRKMSKSYGNFIALSEEAVSLNKKVLGMVTDETRIRKSDPGHPDTCNVCSYYRVFAQDRVETVEKECTGALRGCVDCKRELAEILENTVKPIRARREEILGNSDTIDAILADGKARAASIARDTMNEVRDTLHLPLRKA
ncbi:MAG: tryptophan--tRNA ligase [Planctomycetes bacterium]|nr:tryptophan--tRNA ligase [Planctomycetota bacterium]